MDNGIFNSDLLPNNAARASTTLLMYDSELNSTNINSKSIDFPVQITSTDKGNLMLVTDAETSGFRHHWSLHSRRNYKEGAVERFACIKCKNDARTDSNEKNPKEIKVLFVSKKF